MDRLELYRQIISDLGSRADWETKQRIWYQMRHDGLSRRAKPWPGASDLHYAIADTKITQIKGFFLKQIFGNELLATFVPKNADQTTLARIAEKWFDYQGRYQCNYPHEAHIFTDNMLQSGECLVKVLYDHNEEKLCLDAVDPIAIILPPNTTNVQKTDRLVHVLKYSEEGYRRRKDYRQDEAFVSTIKGNPYDATLNDSIQLDSLEKLRQGFSDTYNQNCIVVWEVWIKEDGKWIVRTFSPKKPEENIKDPFESPFNHGKLPFVPFNYEVKGKDFYSSRGIPELTAPEEAYATKLLNEKSDCITICNRPVFRPTGNMPITNPQNITLNPGSVIQQQIEPIIYGTPPIDWDKEISSTLQRVESRVGTPDMGSQSPLQAMGKDKTATEVNYIAGLNSVVVDMRATIFRESLTELYNQMWQVLLQYQKANFEYFYRDEMGQATPEALKDIYMILPSGNVDSYNKQAQLQKKMALFQMFNGDQFIRQDELRKMLLEEYDPTLISKIFQNPQEANANQTEDQAGECILIEQGFPAQVKPNDDHAVHMSTIIGRLQMLAQAGNRLAPLIIQRYIQHVNDHLFMFKSQKGKQAPQAKQFEDAFKQALAPFMPQNTPFLQQGAQQAPQPQAMPV